MTRADLLVVGGGPAGAALAAMAAGAGVRVVLLERARFPRDKVCGEFLAGEGVAVLDRLGLHAQLLSAGAHRIGSCRVTGLRGEELTFRLPHGGPRQPSALGLSRALLDAELLGLAGRRGTEIQQRREATAPLYRAGRVAGLVTRPVGTRGRAEPIRATLVVGADGRRSRLARSLDPRLGDPRRSVPSSWIGLKRHLDADPGTLAGRVELHLFDGGYAGLAPVEERRVNLCLMTRVRALRAAGGSPARLVEERLLQNLALRERIAGARPAGSWHAIGPLGFGPRRPTAAGALFVGDAAGTVDPFTGEGMANALLGAELALPHVLHAIEAGGLWAPLARCYERDWARAFAAPGRRARVLGRLLGHPRLAGAALALLRGPARRLTPRIVAATRTGAH